MKKLSTNGIELAYEERGTGDPLICIMGITAPGSVWELHALEWEKHFRCILVDNRGVGDSDKPEGPYSTEMMADDCAGLIDALDLGKAHVVGCSMGSTIAQQLALRHPGKVSSLILMCTWARCDNYAKSVFRHMKHIKARLTPDEFMEYIQLLIFTKTHWDDPENLQALIEARQDARLGENPQPLHALEAQAEACINHHTLDRLKDITCPALVLGGKNDIFTPPWMGTECAQAIPDSTLKLFDHAGHAFHWECLEEFNATTLAWLQQQTL